MRTSLWAGVACLSGLFLVSCQGTDTAGITVSEDPALVQAVATESPDQVSLRGGEAVEVSGEVQRLPKGQRLGRLKGLWEVGETRVWVTRNTQFLGDEIQLGDQVTVTGVQLGNLVIASQIIAGPTPTPTPLPDEPVLFEINTVDDTGTAQVTGLLQVNNIQEGEIVPSQLVDFVLFLEDPFGSSLLTPDNSSLANDGGLNFVLNDLFLDSDSFISFTENSSDPTTLSSFFSGDFTGNDGSPDGNSDDSILIEGRSYEKIGEDGDPLAEFCSLETVEFALTDPLFQDGFESGDVSAWCEQN